MTQAGTIIGSLLGVIILAAVGMWAVADHLYAAADHNEGVSE